MMRRSLITTLLLLLAINSAFAKNEAEDFFYKRGYDAGFSAGYDEGVKQAFKEAKKILVKYQNDIRAYELGKYLVANKNLTYPQVWQETMSDGSVKLSITQSRISKQLNIADIFTKFGTLPVNPNPQKATLNPLEARNSVYLTTQDVSNTPPNSADKFQKIITISIEKSSSNEEILKKANLVYAEDDDKFKVMFFNKTEKDNFCGSFGICR